MNLWILSEERPKPRVILGIIEKVCCDKGYSSEKVSDKIVIIPLFEGGKFTFTYRVEGINVGKYRDIFLKIVGGDGSFVDFLLFEQDDAPSDDSTPIYAIEETKTDDSESRNTGVYQRCSKFVYIDMYYPKCKKIMWYNLQKEQKKEPTATNIFGTRMLLTLGVEIVGKTLGKEYVPFGSIEELITFKKNMRRAPKGNIPISITKYPDKIVVSGRLVKAGTLSHDPNIGALSLISKTLRTLGWNKRIVITQHGLSNRSFGRDNKFIRIANKVGVELEGLELPKTVAPAQYWHYEKNSEKIATILIHIISLQSKELLVIYENHAGCERGYFFKENGEPLEVHKYKHDDKRNGIINIPDLIIRNKKTMEVYVLEGKTYQKRREGIEDLGLFDAIENEYIKEYYKEYRIHRGVVLFGSNSRIIEEKEVIFLLNDLGEIILSDSTPPMIKEIVKRITAKR